MARPKPLCEPRQHSKAVCCTTLRPLPLQICRHFLLRPRDAADTKCRALAPPRQRAPRPGFFGGVFAGVNDLIGSAAGYDERILMNYGTQTDEKRRRKIGRAILVATAVGALGWFVKILMSFEGWLAPPIALTIGSLYAVLSYSLESFFAGNVNPFASLGSKLGSLTGRSLLSVVIAFAGALPWVTMSLKSSVRPEMSRLALAQHAALRGGVDTVYGVAATSKKAEALQAETQSWSTAITTLPPALQSSIEQAQACAADYDRLKQADTT